MVRRPQVLPAAAQGGIAAQDRVGRLGRGRPHVLPATDGADFAAAWDGAGAW